MPITVNIEISEDGEIKIEPTGYKDGQCMTDLDDLEAYLSKVGVQTETTDQKRKPESYAKATQRAHNYAKQ